jgi:cell division protein FtsZ
LPVAPAASDTAQRPAPSPAHAEYAKRSTAQAYRPVQGSLDPHGRTAPPRSVEDEQLEIPAFLRRQAN